MKLFSRPLVTLARGGFDEVAVHGQIVAHDGTRIVYQSHLELTRFPTRSLLKPFQFLATGLSLAQSNGETSKWTPALGSISATEAQESQIEKWFPPSYSENKLKLLPTMPFDETQRVSLRLAGRGADRRHHMCFAKHMAILDACEKRGWSQSDYNSEKHPYHNELKMRLGEILGEGDCAWVTDGCTLPSPVLDLGQMANLYQALASRSSGTPLAACREAMMRHPEWIGGPGRVDSLLMEANPDRIVAKEGADGLLAIGVVPNERFPQGLGIVLKIEAGFYPALTSLAIAPMLEALRLKSVHQIPVGQEPRFHYRPFEKLAERCLDISPLVHSGAAVFPGDVPFHRHESLSTHQSSHLTLSSIETTVHVGAHADAPNHFSKSPVGIDQVDVNLYWGPCQVIEVNLPSASTIQPGDITDKILSTRVLFKTNSFPDPNRFNPDFVSLSAELIRFLAKHGVRLVGIDTASIDPSDSKELPAHLATLECGMAILEGIVLSDVEAGVYELSAIPLKIQNGDASPVRAVLRKP